MHSRKSMKAMLIAFAFGSLAAVAIWLSGIFAARPCSHLLIPPASFGTCVDRYDYLLAGAKAALIRGDRASTVQLLEQAEKIIPACPALQDGVPAETALLASKEQSMRSRLGSSG